MPSKYNFQFTKTAENDLADAMNYIIDKLCNKKAALDLLDETEKAIMSICEYPYSYPDCSFYYIKDVSIRHANIDNYVLIYKIDDNMISVLRFVYSKRKEIL